MLAGAGIDHVEVELDSITALMRFFHVGALMLRAFPYGL
jgi:hypothetical protein